MNLDDKLNKIICVYINCNLFLNTSLLLIILLIDLIHCFCRTKSNFFSTLIFCYFFLLNFIVDAAAPIYYYPKIDNICDYYAAIQKLSEHPECTIS